MKEIKEIVVDLIKKTIFKNYPEIASVTVDDSQIYDDNLEKTPYRSYYVSFDEERDNPLTSSKRGKIREEVNMFFEMLGIETGKYKNKLHVFFHHRVI